MTSGHVLWERQIVTKMVKKSITFKELSKLIMKQAKDKGFGVDPEKINVPEKIALIHSEVSEAYDAYRHKEMDGKDGFKMELGDIVSRVLHLAGVLDIDIEEQILKKIDSNKDRNWDWKKMNESHD